MDESNPYLGLIQQDSADNIRQSLQTAVDKQPDTEARLQGLAKQYDLPVEAVRLDTGTVERRAKLDAVDYDTLAKSLPATGNLLSDPKKAAIAHDDIDNLGHLETLLNSFKRGVPALESLPHALQVFNQSAGLDQLDKIDQAIATGEPDIPKLFGDRLGVLGESYARLKTPEERQQFRDFYQPKIQQRIGKSAADLAGLQVERNAIPAPSVVGNVMRAPDFSTAFGEVSKDPLKFIEAIGPESLIQSMPGLLAAIPASLYAGPAGAAGTIGANSTLVDYAGELVGNLQNAGVDVTDPNAITEALQNPQTLAKITEQAAKHAGVVGLFDAISGGIASKAVLPQSVAGKLVNRPLAQEMANIALQLPIQAGLGAAGEAGGEIVAGQDIQPGNILAEAFGELFGTPSEVMVVSGKRIHEQFSLAQQADQQAAHIEQINQIAAASKVLQRDPAAMQSFIDEALANSHAQNVYIDAQSFAQSGVAEQIAASLPDVAQQLPTALATGGEIKIAMSDYVSKIAATEYAQPLVDHIRIEGEEFSRAGAKQYMDNHAEELQAEVARVLTHKQTDESFQASILAVKDTIKQQLAGVSRFTDKVNDHYAALLSNFYAVQADKFGKTPEELFSLYPVNVASQSAGGNTLSQTEKNNQGDAVTRTDTNGIASEGDTTRSTIATEDNNPDTILFQRRSSKRDDYTLDLFDVPAEAGKADSTGTDTGGGLSRDDAPTGTYGTRTQIVEENTRQLGADLVSTPEQAAQALAYLSKSTVERFDALITDKDGKPLAIVGAFKGAIDQASVYPATIAGEAFRINGAANIWFAHNHPSGINELSAADRAMNKKLAEVFRGSEITPRGIFAIAGAEGNGRQWVYESGEQGGTDQKGTTTQPDKTKTVPVVERVYAEEGKLADPVSAPNVAKSTAKTLSKGESGVMLMDNQHAPVAFIPLKSEQSETLRTDGRMDALHRGLSMANAAAAIIVNQGDMTSNAVMNLAGFFNSNQVRVLDVLDKNGEAFDSRADVGLSFSRDTFNQGTDSNRGAFNPATRTITLLDKADLSTFLHESGHFFLEMQFDLAANLRAENDLVGTTAAQKQLLDDTDALLKWFGLESIEEWYNLDFEQKRSYHEQFAEGFEKYLFEGNAPSLPLARIFASFRQWMKKVYEHVRDHFKDIELTDEVRQVFDRMLATDEEIKLAQQARSMMPLFADQAQSGMTTEEYAAYQAAGQEATSTAMEQLALKGLRDMQWLQNARNRELKKLQRQHDELRREVRAEVRMEVLKQPVYRAWKFLTGKISADDKLATDKKSGSDPGKVDGTQDSLFTAIAKLGGLDRQQLESEWNWDQPGRSPVPVFGKPLVRKEGGLSIEAMAEKLLDEGYLTPDANGKYDFREFEDKFDAELRGQAQYSLGFGANIFTEEGKAGEQVINPSGLNAGRIEYAALKSLFDIPDAVVNRLVDLKMTAKDGLHPDIIAELFGFSSGDELVKKLADSPTPKDEIERLTDERMLQNYGDLSTPDAIQRAADLAIHNEVRARFITTEANALAKATGSLRLLGSAAKEFAEAMVARVKVRDISPAQFARAEVRAAKAAAAAEKAGKLDIAAAEKRNQIINVQATRAAYQAQDDVEAGLRYFRKLEADNNKIDPEYKDQIYRELERFDLRKTTNKVLDKRKSLSQWAESQREQGYEPDIPLELLNEAGKISYKDMTVEEFRGLVDTIKQIEHLGRLKNTLLTAKKNRNFEEVKQEIVGSIIQHAGTRIADTRTPTTNAGRTWQFLKGFYASHIKASTWARILDGGQDGGSVWEYFIRSANDRGEYEATRRADATEKLTTILNPIFKMGKMGGKGQFFPSIGRSLNREMRLAMALNTGNDGNLQRLLGGEGWSIEQITPVLQTLTAEEWQAVQRIWDYFDSYRPEIGAKERRVYGKEPNWVEPKPVIVQTKTAAGEPVELRLTGGYYPIKYDPLASQRAEQHASAEEAKRQMQGAYSSATTRRSFTKNREEAILGRPLLYSLSGVYAGINEVIHDLAWHEWLIDMNKLMKSHSIDQAIRGHYGPEVVRQFKSWEQDIAGGDQAATNAGEIALGKLRQGISAAGLGFNAMSAAMQVLGLTQSIVRVGAPWIGRGIFRFIGDPKGALREVNDKSEFMRNRSRTRFRELNELRNRVQDETPARAAIRSGTFLMMMKAQQLVDVPTWLGAYDKAIADLNEEERAIALADQAVIDAQGGGQTKDLSAMERDKLMKLFTVFYSFMNTAFNLGVAQTMTEKKKAKLAVDYLMLYSAPPVLGFFLKEALTADGGGDDDWDELSKKLLAQQIDYLMGLMVIVREFSDAVKTVTGANDMGRDYQGPAGLRFITDIGKLGSQAYQGEFDEAFRKAAINVLGDLTSLPSAQVNRTISGAEALNDGKTENPMALVFGFRQ
jgi:hypothetical protein